MSFCTVLHNLRSPQNVGTIVRTHVAFNGNEVVFVGHDKPWSFRKGSQAFSRKLERLCQIIYMAADEDFFAWCATREYTAVAVEIHRDATPVQEFRFPSAPALVFGSERDGLSRAFVDRCPAVVRIPQPGRVGSLNVSVAAAISMYELRRGDEAERPIVGSQFAGEPRVSQRSRLTNP